MGSHTRFNVLLLLLFLPQAKQIFGKLICVFVTSCGKCGTVSEGEKVVHGVKTQEPKWIVTHFRRTVLNLYTDVCKICLNTSCDQVDLCCHTVPHWPSSSVLHPDHLSDRKRCWGQKCETVTYMFSPYSSVILDWLCNIDLPLQVYLSRLRFCPSGVCYCVLCGAPLCSCTAFHICCEQSKLLQGKHLRPFMSDCRGNNHKRKLFWSPFQNDDDVLLVIYHHRLKDRFEPFITLMPLSWMIELYFCCLLPFSSLLIHL